MARRQHVKQFLGNSVWSGLSTVARTGSALVVNKLFALYYGPNGITLLAHFQNLVALLTTLPNTGVNVGLIKHLAHSEPSSDAYRTYFWAGFWFNFGTFLGALLALLLFPDFFLERFGNGTLSPEGINLWLGLGIFVLLLLQLFWLAVLLARQALRPYVCLSLLTSFCSILLTWWAVGQVDLFSALLIFLVGQAVSGVVGGWVLYLKNLIPAIKLKVPVSAVKDLGKFLIMALSTLIGEKLVEFVVREIAIQRFSLYETGLWQAVVKISDSYSMVYVSILGMVYYPKIAALLPQPAALREYVRSILLLLVPLVGVGLLVVGFLREFFILVLFQEEFLPAQDLMDYQLLGDFLKMAAFLFTYLMTVQARVKLFVVTELASGVLYVGLVAWLMPKLGLEGLPMAHAIRYALYLLLFLFLYRSYLFSK